MKRFVDRIEELSALDEEYRRPEASLVVVYGRRRVGKTELLSEFIKGKRALYFLATEESIVENRNSFRLAVAEFTQQGLLRSGNQFSWDVLFEQTAQAGTDDEKVIIVLDEFQYLGKAEKAFPSILQRTWDTQLRNKRVMLILCGSLISMMEEQALSYSSPLYGRRTAQFKLQQIPFSYYHEFFADAAPMDGRRLIEYYSVTGGVPKYVELFRPHSTVYDDIDRNILRRDSYLYEEPRFLLQNEVQEVGTYFSIIKAIAAGNRKLGQIGGVLETKVTNLTRPLKTLVDLDILEREVPVTEEKPETCKQGQYKIKDNFLAFWFQFVFPYQSFIEGGHPEIVSSRIRANLIKNHTAYVYEDICRQSVWDRIGRGEFPALYNRVGRWWGNRDVEIDIVALDTVSRNDILFGECKFYESAPVGADVLTSLQAKAKSVSWGNTDRRETFVIFSETGFSDALVELAQQQGNVKLLSCLSAEE